MVAKPILILAVFVSMVGLISAYNTQFGQYAFLQLNTTYPSTLALGFSTNYSATMYDIRERLVFICYPNVCCAVRQPH